MICSSLLENNHTQHGFFTRNGGCSTGIYGSLNCGLGSDDSPENILKNRKSILKSLNAPDASLCGLYQIHSNIVHYLEKPWANDMMPKGDAVVTRMKNVALGILTADCAPVLFSDARNGVIGAAHAGWKGAVTGIIETTIQMMCRNGAKIADINAVVGPCIAQKNYEVGPEFREKFLDDKQFFISGSNKKHYLFNLKGFVFERLKKAKINKIELLPHDTYGDEDNFFSYRRATHLDEKDYGRQISVIMRL